MADIFISYASEDRSRAESLAKKLEEQGWSVWWDRSIPPGKTFDQVIEEAITAARCIVVLWSKKSIKSDWVKEEANIGKERKVLVPAKIDPVNLPLGFGRIQAADLTDWDAEKQHPGFFSLLDAISRFTGAPPKIEDNDKVTESLESSLEQQIELQPEEAKISQPTPRPSELAKIKSPEPKHIATSNTKPELPQSRKTSNSLKFGAVAGVIVLLIFGIWWWISESPKRVHQIDVERKIERILEEIAILEQKVSKSESLEQLNDLNKKRDVLGRKLSVLEQMAEVVEVSQKAEKAHNRLEELTRLLITQEAVEEERIRRAEEERKRKAAEKERIRRAEEERKRKAAEEERIRRAKEERKRKAAQKERIRKAVQPPYYKKVSFGYNGCDVKFGDLKKRVSEDYMIRLATKFDAVGFTYHPSLRYGQLIIGDYPQGCKSRSNLSWPLYLKVN